MDSIKTIKKYAEKLSLKSLVDADFDSFLVPKDSYAFMADCLKTEHEHRQMRAKERRIKQARLPALKTFAAFDTSFQASITDEQLSTLANMNWVDNIYNLILLGPPGTGKTHVALAIGNSALDMGYKVFFCSMDTLIHILKTHEIAKASAAKLNYIKKCHLLIIDTQGGRPRTRLSAY